MWIFQCFLDIYLITKCYIDSPAAKMTMIKCLTQCVFVSVEVEIFQLLIV